MSFMQDRTKELRQSKVSPVVDVLKKAAKRVCRIFVYQRPHTDVALNIYAKCMGKHQDRIQKDDNGEFDVNERTELDIKIKRATALEHLTNGKSRVLFESLLHEIETEVVAETDNKEVGRYVAIRTRDLLLRVLDIMREDGHYSAALIQNIDEIQKNKDS